MAKITVAIPAHEMEGKGAEFLKFSLDKIYKQTFKDFDVVVSDNSDNDEIKNVCKDYERLTYYRNPKKGMAPNTNAAIKKSTGELIKILYLDDFLAHENSLKEIVENFRDDEYWLVSGCLHTYDGETFERPHYPNYHERIYDGSNTIGSPSVLTIRNKKVLLFDEEMTWLLDCELYKRYREKHGLPRLLNSLNVVIRQGAHQMTNIIPQSRKESEYYYSIKKHG